MKPDQPGETQILGQYLLGQFLAEEELERVEGRYFADDEYFNRLLEAEDDLIDSYVRGELDGEQKVRFETHFLSAPRRREKWEVQQAIAEVFRSREDPASSPSPLGWLRSFLEVRSFWAGAVVVATLALAVFGAGLLCWRYLQLRNEAADLRSRLVAVADRQPARPLRTEFELQPGLIRSGPGQVLTLRPGADPVILRLHLSAPKDPRPSFFVGTLTLDGEEIWRQARLVAHDQSVEVELPSSALVRGDYVVSLEAITGTTRSAMPSYIFRVDR